MNEPISLYTFPCNTIEALAMLYHQNQDLSGLSPSEIQEKYWKAYREIKKDYKERKDYYKNL